MTLFLVFALIMAVIVGFFGLCILADDGEPVGLVMAVIAIMFFYGGMHQAEANKQAKIDHGNMVQYRAQATNLRTELTTLKKASEKYEERIEADERALAETGKQLASERAHLEATKTVLVRTQDKLAQAQAESAVAGEQLNMCENTKEAYKVTLEKAEGKLTQIKQVLGE